MITNNQRQSNTIFPIITHVTVIVAMAVAMEAILLFNILFNQTHNINKKSKIQLGKPACAPSGARSKEPGARILDPMTS